MAERSNWLYWDISVFLSYFNKTPDRHSEIDGVLRYIRSTNGSRLIVTSTLTKVEVSYYQDELNDNTLSSDTEEILDFFLNDRSVILFVDVTNEIARRARHLKRVEYSLGRVLKTLDAIHLASASFMGISEMHSYDRDHLRLDGKMTFRICTPRVIGEVQENLF